MNHSSQMGIDSIPRLLWRFSIPAILGSLVHATYNIVDRVYLGHLGAEEGALGIAATTVTFPIIMILMACGMMIAHGANAIVSMRLGAKKQDEAEAYLGQAVVLLVVLAISFMTVGLVFLKPLLRFFEAPPDVLPAAADYLRIILIGVPVHLTSYAMNNFIRGEGNPRTAMFTMVIAAGTNLILDPIFIFGFGWGITGAAVATVLAQAFSSAWVLWYFLGGRSQLKIRLHHLRFHWQRFRHIVAIGSPPFAMQAAGSVALTLMNKKLLLHGGTNAVAAMGIIYSIQIA